MSPVPHGLSALPESDGRAIATYFADVDHAADRSASIDAAVARALPHCDSPGEPSKKCARYWR
jgi:hypothetical protein